MPTALKYFIVTNQGVEKLLQHKTMPIFVGLPKFVSQNLSVHGLPKVTLDHLSAICYDLLMPGLKKCDDDVHPNHLIIAAAAAAGVKTGDLAKALNITPQHVSRVKQNSKEIQWLTQKRIKKAIQAVDYFTDVKNYTGYTKKDKKGNEVVVEPDLRIKPSDVLKASEMQLDRAFPRQQTGTEAQSISFTQVNVNHQYFSQPQVEQIECMPALDVVCLPDSSESTK